MLLAAIALTAIRAAYILYHRHAARTVQTTTQVPPLNPDYYVAPKKLYPYDLKSARQLTQQPVWVKEGYRYTYYPYDVRAIAQTSRTRLDNCYPSKNCRFEMSSPT